MSMPKIENSGTKPCEAIADILQSIALEETGLAHIINAEGEKIQKVVCEYRGCNDIEDLLKVNKSVSKTLVNVIKLQMLLEFKLEEVDEIICKVCH